MKAVGRPLAWISATVVLVALVAMASFWTLSQMEEAAREREHTSSILNSADDLMLALVDAETGQRGYLLTNDVFFLEEYLAVRDQISEQRKKLRQLVQIGAAQKQLDALTPLIEAKLAYLSRNIELRRNHDMAAALANLRSSQGKPLMDSIRAGMGSFLQLEEAALAQRAAKFELKIRYLFAIIVIASVCALLFAVAFARLIYRGAQLRIKAREHLETEHLLEVQQQANATLQLSEERLAVTLQSIGDGVIATDAQGCVMLLNPVAEQLTGWTQREASGRPVDEVFQIINQETRQPAVVPVMATLTLGTVQGLANHTMLIARDGSERPIADSCGPIRNRNAQVVGAVLVFRDVTEEYAAQQAMQEQNSELISARALAEQANRAKSDFLATMSHEIRTPMNGVIGMIEVLQQSSLNSAQMEMANIIHDSAFSLLAVINDVLDFSKIEAGKLPLESIPMSVANVVEGVCQTMDRMALKKMVELTLFTDPAIPPEVLGDPGRLRQVLINLLNNAIKFSGGQQRTGRVSVRALLVQSTTEQVVLEFLVTDNGIGMDEESQARLFAPFMQADSSTTRNFGGTGLGLVISRRLTRMMGGEITLQSRLAEGATLKVRIAFDRTAAESKSCELPPVLAGLPCLVLAEPGKLVDDLVTYLAHDKALVQRATDLAAARQWTASPRAGASVVIIDSTAANSLLDELRAAARAQAEQQTRFVVIGRGRRRLPRLEGADLVFVDGNVLTHAALLKAVATAAGRVKAPEREPGPEAVDALPSRADTRQQHGRILIAEDNEINQKVIRQQLLLLGYTADISSNGREALRRWRSGNYAILFADLHMPEMDGYELTAAIRTLELGRARMPIIAFTANVLKGEAEHCLAIGMDDYLSKPVQLVNLKAMLKKWLPVIQSTPMSTEERPDETDLSADPVAEIPVPLDVGVLRALIGSDGSIVGEFLRDFRLSASNIARDMQSASAAGQFAVLAALAHKLKSSARSVGALALGELCAAMETAGHAGNAQELALLRPRFDQELVKVDDFLRRY